MKINTRKNYRKLTLDNIFEILNQLKFKAYNSRTKKRYKKKNNTKINREVK
jgi:hypothetical protein